MPSICKCEYLGILVCPAVIVNVSIEIECGLVNYSSDALVRLY